MRCAIVSAAIVGLASAAQGEVSLTFDGMNAHQAVRYNFQENAAIDAPTRVASRFALAGELGFNNRDLSLFCIELLEPVSDGTETYQLSSFSPGDPLFDRGRILASLFDQYYEEDGFSSASNAAAFAMMTWEIMSETYDSSSSLDEIISQFSMTEGAVQFGDTSTAAQDRFEQMRQTLVASDDTSALTIYQNDDYQNFVGYNIPAPGAIALLAIAGIAGSSRRRRD